MANFPSPAQLQAQYFQILQSIKPSININDQNSDFVIRGLVLASFASGIYGDQAKVDNNTFIKSSSPEALTLHGADLGITQLAATQSTSTGIQISGVDTTVVNPGDLTFIYNSTGITYTNTTGGTIASGVLTVSIQSTTSGAITNVASPASLTLIAPPTGINSTALINISIAGGTDVESTDSYRARLLSRLQSPPSGGNLTDIREMAFNGDASVRGVIVIPFALGLGTVAVYIYSGPANLDSAITNGQSIVRIPSQSAIDNVQAYYNANAPITECISVYAPSEITLNETVYVDLASGYTLSSVPSDPVNNPLGLTVQQLIQREYGRALYHVPVGGWPISGQTGGFVIASYIEESMATWLSAQTDPTTGLAIGLLPILADIRVPQLNPPSTNLAIGSSEMTVPGTITVVLGT